MNNKLEYELREALQAQMQATILLLSKYEYSQQEIEDCTSQARHALAMPSRDDRVQFIYDDEMFNRGVTHTVDLLAKTIGAEGWVAGDGSEDYDSDLAQTLLNILEAKGLFDSDDAKFLSEKHAQISDALRLLWDQVVASGNAKANDFGWPKACAAVRDALSLSSQDRATGE